MIHYIFLSYILFPISFSFGVYLQQKIKLDNNGKSTSWWRWLKFVLGDFYKGKLFWVFLFSPIMLPIEICLIIKYLLSVNNKPKQQ